MAESWRLTERDRRGAWTAAAAVASTFFGPFAPAVMWGFDYLYDRRDLIFGTGGAPAQAVAADGSQVRLSALGQADWRQSTPLTIVINLDASALNLGLKNGDPVSVVVTGHSYVQSRSGLVVPARVGEPVTVGIPRGGYSVAAFGSRQGSQHAARQSSPFATRAEDVRQVRAADRCRHHTAGPRTHLPGAASPYVGKPRRYPPGRYQPRHPGDAGQSSAADIQVPRVHRGVLLPEEPR